MLAQTKNYDELVRNFHWRIPRLYNMGVDASDRHATEADDWRSSM